MKIERMSSMKLSRPAWQLRFLLLLVILGGFTNGFSAQNPFRPQGFGEFLPLFRPDEFRIGFWDRAQFDPAIERPPLDSELILLDYPGDGTGYYLIQFAGPVYRERIEEIRRRGVLFVGFHSRYLAFAKMTRDQKKELENFPFIRWVGIYQPGYKFHSQTLKETGFGRATVSLFYPEDISAAISDLSLLGCEIVRWSVSEDFKVIEVDCSREQVLAIAKLPYVFSIEEWHPPELENEKCQWVVQTWSENVRRIWDQGVYGVEEILGFTDTGLDVNHWAFLDPSVPITDTGEFPTHRKVALFKNYTYRGVGDPDGHGTHVAGTIGGNDSINGGTNPNDGHSKGGRLAVLSPIPQPTGWDLTGPFNMLTNWLRNPSLRARTISNSWWTGTMGQYTNASASTDVFCWRNKDVVLIKSCGNQGQGSQYRITEPGNSKSIIACASLQNGLNSTILSSFSSRGPASDNRIKPDIAVPGEGIYSAQRSTQNSYVSMSGTSMAAPCVNGSIGLIREYLKKGFYPTGARNPDDSFGYVSAALLKACVLVSADPNIGSYTIPSEYVGWGRLNIDSVLYFSNPTPDRRKLFLNDDTVGLSTGQYREYEFEVNDAIPLRVAVVWTDTAAAPGANPCLINNLDCELFAPDGGFYRGNIYSGGQSVRNPSQPFDNLNPLEIFRINSPPLGRWLLRVSAQNVVTSRQPYAVVVTGGLYLRPAYGVRYHRHRIVDLPPGGNGDGIINPGESCEMPTWVMNYNTYPVRGVKTYLRLRLPDPNITITDSFKHFSRIEPQDSAFTGADGFNFSVSSVCTNGYSIPFKLVTRDTLDSIWESNINLLVGTPLLFTQGLLVWDSPPGGNGNGRIDPGEYVSLAVGVKNSGLGNGYSVYAILKSGDSRFIVIDSFGRYDTILKDLVKFNLFDKFRVYAQPNIPREFPVPCTLKITSERWSFIRPFTILVGEMTIADPIPDGPRTPPRYWAYDEIDSLYGEVPRFNWIEIRNRGTQLPINSDDQTIRIPLPFTFKFYGQRYTDSLSVCSNGWISPIRTTSTVNANRTLPDPTPANPSAMICPCWDDLDPRYGNKIWYLYEPDSHRFILEWDSVHYYSPNTRWDKFQIIVYDTTNQTSTGDNEIIFQYLTANNYGSITIGIEDETNTIGINALYNNIYDRRCAPIVPGRAIKFTSDEPVVMVKEDKTASVPSPRFLVNTIAKGKVFLYSLPFPEGIKMSLYTITGRKIKTLTLPKGAKRGEVIWRGEDESGRRLPPGIYLLRLEGKGIKEKIKIILLR